MAKIITVFGPPNTGKTTFAINLAREIYSLFNCHICILSPDNDVPLLPVIFPTRKEEELFSLGEALSKPAPTQEDALLSLTTVRNTSGLCVAGFKRGENRYTYPEFTTKSAENYLESLGDVTDIIIADCVSHSGNVLSEAALKSSGTRFTVYTPELRCISWLNSRIPYSTYKPANEDNDIKILSIPFKDIFLPQEEVKAAIGRPDYTLPYSHKAKRNMICGEMLSASPGREYEKAIKKICERTF